MKKHYCTNILLATALLLAGCSSSVGQGSSPVTSIPQSSSLISSDSEIVSQGASSINLAIIDENELISYALILAKNFREPVAAADELIENPHLYEFLVNATFQIYKNNGIELESVSDKDWYEEYLIPNADMEKAAGLLLNTSLPDVLYTDAAFGYDADKDAFCYSPFSPPMFITECENFSQNSDGTFSVEISLSRIEENIKTTNIYVFEAFEDVEWGQLYRLVRIDRK